jgi:hypothetical protein
MKKYTRILFWGLLIVMSFSMFYSLQEKPIADPVYGNTQYPGMPPGFDPNDSSTYPPVIVIPPKEESKEPTEGDKGIISSLVNLPKKIMDEISDFFLKDVKKFLSDVVRSDIEYANRKLVEFQEELTESDLGSSEFAIARTLWGAMKPIAYSLLALFFMIGFVKKAMYFEMMNDREIYKTVLLFIFGKILIDKSFTICEMILRVNNGIVRTVINTVGSTNQSQFIKFVENDRGQSMLTVIGNFFRSGGFMICFLIALLIAQIILILRKLEIAVLTSVSPLFISTFGADTSMDVFKNFIKNYISVVAQTIWISIAFSFLVNAYISGITVESGGLLPGWDFLIGGVALAIYCINAPNSVKSAIGGSGGGGLNLSSLLHLL